MRIQLPHPASARGDTFDVFVNDGDSVLRLPAPRDQGRPAWIDAETTRTLQPDTASVASAPAPTPDASTTVRQAVAGWLARLVVVPDEQRPWLAQQVGALAADSTIRQAALVNSEDNFGLVFEPALERHLTDAVDADPDSPAALLYFRDDDFAGAFNAFARHAVYQAIHDHPNPTESPAVSLADTNAAAGRLDASPRGNEGESAATTTPQPPAPQNAAQLARLDSADRTQHAPPSRASHTGHHSAQPAPTRRAPGL